MYDHADLLDNTLDTSVYDIIDCDELITIEDIDENNLDECMKRVKEFYAPECLTFNAETFIQNGIMSYKILDDIYQQIYSDLPRTDIVVNNKRITDPDTFIKMIMKYDQQISVGEYSVNISLLLALLSTQTAFFLPYAVMRNIFINNDNNKHLSCMDRNIHFAENNLGFIITYDIEFATKLIPSGKVIKKIKTFMTVQIDFEKGLTKSGLIIWN